MNPATLSVALLLVATAPIPAQRPNTADRAQSKRTRFLRLLRDRDGQARGLQTAIVRYEAPDSKAGLVVDLIGVVHIADRGYYQRLNERFTFYDAVLYELVAPEGAEVPRKTGSSSSNPIAVLRKLARSLLDFESQLDHIDYTPKNFVHADLSPKKMVEAMRERGEDGVTLVLGVLSDLLKQANRAERGSEHEGQGSGKRGEQGDFDPFALLVDPKGTSTLKRRLAEELVRQGNSGLGRTLETILVDDRNSAAMRVFGQQIAKGKKRIAIFYGAAHMPDFEKRLVLDFGLVRKKVEWRTAWDLRETHKPPIQGMLETLTEELFRELSDRQNRSPARPPAAGTGKGPEKTGSTRRRRRME